tara:strand:+ start:1495 stop:2607 length:1113 start_codon:yes stop_codon:yes gene_type:complete
MANKEKRIKMKFNKWINSINRLFIPRKTQEKNKRFDMAERTTNYEPEFYSKFINEKLNQEDFITYPNYKDYELLKESISHMDGLSAENVYLSTGSGACIKSVCEFTMDSGKNIVTPVPAYPMYNIYGRLYGGEHIGVEYGDSLVFDLSELINQINDDTRLVIISNPFSPIGDYKTNSEIKKLANVCKEFNIILVIDEAYIHFSDGESMVGLLNDYENVLISRTFSKAFGAAGIRLGYLLGNKKLINKITKVQLTYPLSNVTVKFGMYLIDNIDVIDEYVKETKYSRNKLCEILSSKYDVVNSQTNSIHFHEKNGDNRNAVDVLNKHKLAFKSGDAETGTPVKVPGDDRGSWIRLSVGAGIEKLDFVGDLV